MGQITLSWLPAFGPANAEGSPCAAVPVTPEPSGITNFSATASSTSAIDLSWNSCGVGVVLEQSTDGINFTPVTGTIPTSATAFPIANLPDGTTEYFRIGQVIASETVPQSFADPVSATTEYDIDGLTATANSTGQISLTWNDATSFTMLSLYRSIDGGTFEFLTDSYLSPSLSATSTSFTDNTVVEGHDYSYELQGSFSDGTLSAMSQASDAETTVVQNLSYTPTTSSIALNWTDLAPAVGSISSVAVGTSSTANGTYTFNTLTSASALTATISGLSENSETWCEVQITDGAGTAVTPPLDTWTLPNAPSTPSVSMSGGAAVVSWTNNSAGSPPFYIEESTDGTNFSIIGDVAAGTLSYTDGSPSDGTSWYRIDAVSEDGAGYSQSPAASVSTALLAPSDLTAQAVSASEIDLSWTNNSTAADGITILRSTDGGATYSNLATLSDPTNDTFADTTVPAGATYYYKVQATQSGASSSGLSAAAGDTTIPPTPTGLGANAMSPTEVDLTWSPSPGAAGYDIKREASGGEIQQFNPSGAWQTVTEVSAGSATTTYADTGLWDGVSYSYQIDAFNNAGSSLPSDSVMVTTSQAPPRAPTVTAIDLSATSIEVIWANNADNESYFEVDRSLNATGGPWIAVASDIEPGVETYTDTGLSPNTPYAYRVIALNSANDNSTVDPTGALAAESAGYCSMAYTSTTQEPYPSIRPVQGAVEVGPDGYPINGYLAISRAGDVSESGTVTYSVDTSASNAATPGYEYQALSGSATFEAGQNTALVGVTPNEINHVEGATSVTLDVPTGVGSYTVSAWVNIVNTDAANSLTATGMNVSAVVGDPWLGALATFTDGDSNEPVGDYSATITWDDGSTSDAVITGGTSGQFIVSADPAEPHTFSAANGDTINVIITKFGGAEVSATVSVQKYVRLAWNSDDGDGDLNAYLVPLDGGPVMPVLDNPGFPSNLGDSSLNIDWGEGDAPDDGTKPHFFDDGGTYNVSIAGAFAGSTTFAVTVTHAIPADPQEAINTGTTDTSYIAWEASDSDVSYDVYSGPDSSLGSMSYVTTLSSPGFDVPSLNGEARYYEIVANEADGTQIGFPPVLAAAPAGPAPAPSPAPSVPPPLFTYVGVAPGVKDQRAIQVLTKNFKADPNFANSVFVGLYNITITDPGGNAPYLYDGTATWVRGVAKDAKAPRKINLSNYFFGRML